jgi:hypothetical protein
MNTAPERLRAGLLAALLVLPGQAAALSGVSRATFDHGSGAVEIFVAGRECAILLEGPLDDGALRALDAGLRRMQEQGCAEGTMLFNSAGGVPAAAYRVADFLARHRFDTVIADGALCFSACAYAFLGGRRRHIAAQGRFGVHQHAGESVCVPEFSDAEDRRLRAILERALSAAAVPRLLQAIRDTDCATMRILPRADLETLALANHAAPLPSPRLREALAEREVRLREELLREAAGPWTRHADDRRLTVYSRAIAGQKPGVPQRLWALVSYAADHSETVAEAPHRSQLMLNEIDCERGTIARLGSLYTREAMGEGAVVARGVRLAPQPVRAGTPAAIWYRAACGRPLPG